MVATLSLCNEVVRTLDFASQCAFARAVGYDGIEIAPFTLFDLPELPAARTREVRTTADGEGMPVTGLHWLLAETEGLSITSVDPAIHARTIDFGRRLVALCAELGGAYLVHGSPGQRRLKAGHEAEGRAQAALYFAAMAGEAAAAGLTYLVEPLAPQDSDWINSIDEAVALVRQIGGPGLATMLDCAAVTRAGGDPSTELRRHLPGGFVRHLHFNDPDLRGPGEGELRFAPIIAALSDLGYAGGAAVEPFVYRPDGPATAARAAGYLRGLMEKR